MSQLETAMTLLMQSFDKYACTEGNKDTLTKAELKTMMEQELPGFMKNSKNPAEVDKLMDTLDRNKDQVVDFTEFVTFASAVTCICHDRRPKK